MNDYIHPLIAGIIRELPKAGEPMSARLRKQWISTFTSILYLLYPEAPPEPERRTSDPPTPDGHVVGQTAQRT